MFNASLYITFTFKSELSPACLNNILIFAKAFVPASILHFAQTFPVERYWLRRNVLSLGMPYIISFGLFVIMRYNAQALSDLPERFKIIINFYLAVSFLLFLASTLFVYISPVSIISRMRSKMILIGVVIAFGFPLVDLIQGHFSHNALLPHPLLNLPFYIVFPFCIGYAIAKHNLFDVDVYIKRAVGYGIMTTIIIGIYALVTVFLNVFLGKYKVSQSPAFPILFTLSIILLCNPLKNRIQTFIDRIFFRKDYNYEEIIEKIGGTITSLLDLGQILKQLVETFIDDIFIDTSSIMLLNTAGTEYQTCLAVGEKNREVEQVVLKKDEPLIRIIKDKKSEITIYDVLEDPKYQMISNKCSKVFKNLYAILMVPLIFQDEMIGLLNLGMKKSGKFYNREDIDLINTLANQGAVAIKNARLFQDNLDKQRMEEELAIARDLQSSMLPCTFPKIEGYQIAALSLPAREVGGDFFDFIEIERNKLGLVIGDVAGKSVSGALVMAASRSVFRMLSEEILNTGDIMNRANQRLKNDITKNMFVALLYAVLNVRDQTLSLCSAGQNQPIHIYSENGGIRFIETKGDTFPLGILDDAVYQETCIQLRPGDKVIFYTDGIVEAMNEQKEIFGFERLMEAAKDLQLMTAESLLQGIIDKVKAFSGNVGQDDDLTVIVMSVDNIKS
jgi:serine phosphatase RsbU (regulator of sigma subunit)